MRLRGGGRDGDAAERAAASARALEQGGLPLAAQERLRQLKEEGGGLFTSDLSTNEFLLAREAGFRPLTQVMGSCFYHVGWQWMPSGVWGGGLTGFGQGRTWELETASEAWNEARRLALGRLQEEARLAGADAVVGVRLERGRYDWSADVLEFVAVGTAVRSERYELTGVGSPKPARSGGAGSAGAGAGKREPVLSNLSGQEFAALYRNGWWPAGLVAGTTVSYVVSGWRQQQARFGLGGTAYQNQELEDFTRGIYDARNQAMLRVTRQAHELGAHGLLGVSLETEHHEHEVDQGGGSKRTDLVLTFHVLATAVVQVSDVAQDIFVAVPLT
jgi:uncharacterized protein YbjQ (UPF0145 family)